MWTPNPKFIPRQAPPPPYLVQQPRGGAVSAINWRMVTLVTLLVAGTNLLTFMASHQESSEALIQEVKNESLYLIEKAANYIRDVDGFESKVRAVANELDIPPEWLMAVMYMESKFDPSIQNLRGSGATGLIQFMVPAVKDLNARLGTKYYMSDIRKMSAEKQLHLVKEYLQTVRERYGEYRSLTDLYLGILYPKAMNQEYCYALFAHGTRSYKLNRGLDENRDGVVTNSDIDRRMQRMFPVAYKAKK
ncbi:MAG: transglycosylase SLT domain-containing protein [Bacteroidota bacterium]